MSEDMSDEWRKYGEAVIDSMREVLNDAEEGLHPVLLETADYWLSLGLAIGISRPDEAQQLLHLIESEEQDRSELHADAAEFIEVVRA